MANLDEILNQLKVGIPSMYGWSIKSVGASITIVQNAAGILHNINIGQNSCPSLTIYDNSSGASTSPIYSMDVNYPRGTYIVDFPITKGITVMAAVGNTPDVKLLVK